MHGYGIFCDTLAPWSWNHSFHIHYWNEKWRCLRIFYHSHCRWHTKFWSYRFFVSWRSIFLWLVSCCCLKFFLNKCSASTTESTIPFAKKFSWYKKKIMAHRRSIYKAKTNSFFEDNWRKLEFRGELFGESWFHNSIFQMQLVSLQIMPGICTPYWKNWAWIW